MPAEAGIHRPEGWRLDESLIVMPAEAGIHRPEGAVRGLTVGKVPG